MVLKIDYSDARCLRPSNATASIVADTKQVRRGAGPPSAAAVNLTTPCGPPNRTPYIRHALCLRPPTPRAANANNRLEESRLMPHRIPPHPPAVSVRTSLDCRPRHGGKCRCPLTPRAVAETSTIEKRDYFVVEIVSG